MLSFHPWRNVVTDKADALIKKYYGRLPLKGHAVWDANQLRTYLNAYPFYVGRFTVPHAE